MKTIRYYIYKIMFKLGIIADLPIDQRNVTNSIIDIKSKHTDNIYCENVHDSKIKITIK